MSSFDTRYCYHRCGVSIIETWWDGIEAFLRTGITNAKSEGINRAVKLAARNAYGFRNPENLRLRTCSVTNKVTVPS